MQQREHACSSSPGPFAVPKDYVQLDVALLERPLGDTYINQGLWVLTDETVVGLDDKLAVDGNGFRVGQVVGMLPGDLQALLRSRRSCLNPRRWMVPTDRAAQAGEQPHIVLGPVQPEARFSIKQGGQTTEVVLNNVQYQLDLEPGVTRDGRIRLRFTPRVLHGEATRSVVVAPDHADFMVKVEKPSRTFADLSWEVTLMPDQYLVIGGCYEQPQSLGCQAFTQENAAPPVQRLLVLRASASPIPTDDDDPLPEEMTRSPQTPPPLALQAALSSLRAR
jgi:hypothetical protein